jgi:hypothetical protein
MAIQKPMNHDSGVTTAYHRIARIEMTSTWCEMVVERYVDAAARLAGKSPVDAQRQIVDLSDHQSIIYWSAYKALRERYDPATDDVSIDDPTPTQMVGMMSDDELQAMNVAIQTEIERRADAG